MPLTLRDVLAFDALRAAAPELTGAADQLPITLSSGQRRRLRCPVRLAR